MRLRLRHSRNTYTTNINNSSSNNNNKQTNKNPEKKDRDVAQFAECSRSPGLKAQPCISQT